MSVVGGFLSLPDYARVKLKFNYEELSPWTESTHQQKGFSNSIAASLLHKFASQHVWGCFQRWMCERISFFSAHAHASLS